MFSPSDVKWVFVITGLCTCSVQFWPWSFFLGGGGGGGGGERIEGTAVNVSFWIGLLD